MVEMERTGRRGGGPLRGGVSSLGVVGSMVREVVFGC